MSKQREFDTIDMISWLRDYLTKEKGYSVYDRYEEEPGLPIHLYCTKSRKEKDRERIIENLVIIVTSTKEITRDYFEKLCFCQSYLSLYMDPEKLKLLLVIPHNAKIQEEKAYEDKKTYTQKSYEKRGFGLLRIKGPKASDFKYVYEPITLRNRMEKEFRKEFEYLFSWDKVPGDDSKWLQKYLMEDLGVNWVKNAAISKTDDGKTIIVSAGENSVELILNEKSGKVSLKIAGEKIRSLLVKEENGALNIYKFDKSKAIARFFNNYIDEAVVGIAGVNPVKFEERNIDRKLLEHITNLKNVSYATELRQITNEYLNYEKDDYSFVMERVKTLWTQYFSIPYPDIHERLEPLLKELYPKYREHFLHQFQVFLLGSIMIDRLIRFGKLNGDKDTLSKGWLLAATFHDFAQAIQKYDDWSKTLFKDSLEIDRPLGSLELKKDYVENTFSSSVEHIISCLGKCFCDFDKQDRTENYNTIRHFFYYQVTDKKNHALLSSLSLLKRFEEKGEFHTVILPSATAIAIHDDAIWQALNGTVEKSDGIECVKKLCTIKPLSRLELKTEPLSFLLILCDNIQDWGRHFRDKELEEGSRAANIGLRSINSNEDMITIQLFVNFNSSSLGFLKYKVDTLELVKTLLRSSSPHFLIELWDRGKNEKLDMDVKIGD